MNNRYRIKTSVTINCLPTPVQLYNPIFYHANPELGNRKHHTETPIMWEILDNFLIHVIFIRLFICNFFSLIQILISLISRTNLSKFCFHSFAFCNFIKAFFFWGRGRQGVGRIMPDARLSALSRWELLQFLLLSSMFEEVPVI